jgi:ParB-like chromosome segregation protein Spo0J
METVAIPGKIDVTYTDPFSSVTALYSQSWHALRAAYLAFEVEVAVANAEVNIADIQRNENDHGKWRWDTPTFAAEVDKLIESIKSTNRFEAVWLKKQDGVLSVLDGHHRVVGWQRMGNTTIPAVIVTVTPRKPRFQFQ